MADCPLLDDYLQVYDFDPDLRDLQQRLAHLQQRSAADNHLHELIDIYHEAIERIEQHIWATGVDQHSVGRYQALFRELEGHISQLPHDNRHEFILVIPVADRPRQLDECINSVLQLCEAYQYGGISNQYFSKLTVLIADDSGQVDSISRNQQLARYYSEQGLETIYFGQQEQQAMINSLSVEQRDDIRRIVGSVDAQHFFHKGASITRNITYLKLNQLAKRKNRPLFYFLDSDQEFKVRLCATSTDHALFAINYFYQLDRIFTSTDSRVLTGKVVGDPPVSPAVMGGHFLDDVIGFVEDISSRKADQSCSFHGPATATDEGAYHDMGELFGFRQQQACYPYQCPLAAEHDHVACFSTFADNIKRFFDGEHATRKTCFDYENAITSLKPARTVYTGNFVLRPDALEYFIPFATLKLRMAGPVLGRFIQADMGERFVSAALPMLHKRTLDSLGQSEYRAGINHDSASVDLSAEFERQYYGDVLLFSVEKLNQRAAPDRYDRAQVRNILLETEQQLRQKYAAKHADILAQLQRLASLLDDRRHWWHRVEVLQPALQQLQWFIDNMQQNYGEHSKTYRLTPASAGNSRRMDELLYALMHYHEDRQAWQSVLQGHRPLIQVD
jgi:hypothetical protein